MMLVWFKEHYWVTLFSVVITLMVGEEIVKAAGRWWLRRREPWRYL